MELTVKDIAAFMEEWAPLSYAEDYDNVGLLIGHEDQPVTSIMVAVDASEEVMNQAVEKKVDLLLTHHPLIFRPVKKIVQNDRTGRRLLQLIENKIALYSAHTNLDSAPGGNNDRAAQQLGLVDIQAVAQEGEKACLRIGRLPSPLTLGELAELTLKKYRLPYIRIIGENDQLISKVAFCAGSGMDFMSLAIKEGADAFVTGDITYHKADEAQAAGLGLIDATHFGTDMLSVKWVAEELRNMAQEKGVDLVVWEAEETDIYQTL